MTNGTWLLRRLMLLAAAMAILAAALLWYCPPKVHAEAPKAGIGRFA